MDRKVVDAINNTSETDRFIRGLRAWVGFKQIECLQKIRKIVWNIDE